MTPSSTDKPIWDETGAQCLVGSLILIGLTHVRPGGETFEQMFGEVMSADEANGFEIALSGTRSGETYWLPPHIANFHRADPGEYRLRSTGEIVVDPDYLTTWRIEAPKS